MKTYILQKDLPGVKAGTESEYTGCGYKFYTWHYSQQDIDDSPDFFKLKEDELVTANLLHGKALVTGGEKWELYLSKPISQTQWLAVKSAIEAVLNDAAPETVVDTAERFTNYKNYMNNKTPM